VTKPQFVYVIYIRATADDVWSGLLDPEWTRKYWMHDNISDWNPGSPWTHKRTDPAGTVDIVGQVIESDRPRKLVLTWAQPADAGNPAKTSRVSFELAPEEWPGGPWVRLTVAHTELEPDSDMFRSVSYGWPGLMSGMKTMLERRSFERNP
jgi:uncharacterized protein YndB with AHSA1/START domain